jgi:hypothetical protein
LCGYRRERVESAFSITTARPSVTSNIAILPMGGRTDDEALQAIASRKNKRREPGAAT